MIFWGSAQILPQAKLQNYILHEKKFGSGNYDNQYNVLKEIYTQ